MAIKRPEAVQLPKKTVKVTKLHFARACPQKSIDKDGLADLAAHAQDGDIVKFKVSVGNNRGYKSAIYKVVA